MLHFPGWFVAICVLLPVSNVIYKTWNPQPLQKIPVEIEKAESLCYNPIFDSCLVK